MTDMEIGFINSNLSSFKNYHWNSVYWEWNKKHESLKFECPSNSGPVGRPLPNFNLIPEWCNRLENSLEMDRLRKYGAQMKSKWHMCQWIEVKDLVAPSNKICFLYEEKISLKVEVTTMSCLCVYGSGFLSSSFPDYGVRKMRRSSQL